MTEKKKPKASPMGRTFVPSLFVLSGLSGAGKDAVLDGLKESGTALHRVITATSRPPRNGERDGYDYHFFTASEFQNMIARGELLEWAKVYENYYGIPKKPVAAALTNGEDTVVKVDVQGALTIRRLVPQAVLIFLSPPSAEESADRLAKRGTEDADARKVRILTAEIELEQLAVFNYLVINRHEKLAGAVADVRAIINAEKCRLAKTPVNLPVA
ncbi:guanylate kinase [Chloroflexota bacterium]